MKAFQLQGIGIESLHCSELPIPKCRPHEVLIRVHRCSLNYRDLLVARGEYGKLLPHLVPLSDAAGEVVEIGSEVNDLRQGDRALISFMPAWESGRLLASMAKSALGASSNGTLAEYVAVSSSAVTRLPDFLSYSQAACLPCAALTAWNALFECGTCRPGDSILVQGTGGVSLFALQFAKVAGAKVLLISGSDEKLEKARRLGADALLNYRQSPDWDRWVFEQTDRIGADSIIEVGGAETLARSLRAIRVGGQVHMIGVLSGKGGEFPTTLVLHKQVRMQGIFVGSREMLVAMLRAMELHQIQPVIDREFSFQEAIQAYRYLESANHFGKVVIQVSP